MNELKVIGKQKFMGLEIPVVLGGFGESKKCISDKTVAVIHEMREPDIRRRIFDNIKRFTENVDYIDMKQHLIETKLLGDKSCASDAQQFLEAIGYSQMQISKAEHIYILSERGYVKLIKIMDTDLAWEIHDKLMDEYFEMREGKYYYEELSPELKAIFVHDKKIQAIDRRLDHIENTMTIDYEQQQELQSLAKVVTVNAVGGKKARAYTYQFPPADENDRPPKMYGIVISRLWHDYQDYFRVNSYKNTPVARYEEALGYINRWTPPVNMQLEIGKINREEI